MPPVLRRPALLVLATTLLLSVASCTADTEPPRNVSSSQATLWANVGCEAAGEDGRYSFKFRKVGASAWSETARIPYRCPRAANLQAGYAVKGLAASTQYEYLFCVSADHALVAGRLRTFSPALTACFDQNRDGDTAEPQRFTTLAAATGGRVINVAAGGSLAAAYNQAAAGDTIQLQPGTYPRQEIPSGTKAVTFKGGAGVKLRQLISNASNVTFDGVEVDAGGVKTSGAALELHRSGQTFKNSRVGNVVDEKGALVGSGCVGCVFDNVEFHDAKLVTPGVHMECLYSMAPGITIKNSRFVRCAIFDILFTRGDWWGQPLYGGFTLINNRFGVTCGFGTSCGPGTGAYYSVMWHRVLQGIRNATIRGNTFDYPLSTEGNSFTASVESCNAPAGRLNFSGLSHAAC